MTKILALHSQVIGLVGVVSVIMQLQHQCHIKGGYEALGALMYTLENRMNLLFNYMLARSSGLQPRASSVTLATLE